MTEPADELVERLWSAHRPRAIARLERVAGGLGALARGEDADTEALVRDAHVLVGALGTYGRPGSDLLRECELALGSPGVADATGLASRVEHLLTTLRT